MLSCGKSLNGVCHRRWKRGTDSPGHLAATCQVSLATRVPPKWRSEEGGARRKARREGRPGRSGCTSSRSRLGCQFGGSCSRQFLYSIADFKCQTLRIGHRIRFADTPKHSSWLNRIEMWFSILVRKPLKRSSFPALEDLKERVLRFIDYFNRTMAKPIDWLYSPRPLHQEPSSG